MSAPRCVVIGTGRTAGGFIAPVLHAAGWSTLLVGRDRRVCEAIAGGGGVWLDIDAGAQAPRWIDGITSLALEDPALPAAIAGADLLATSVGPSALVAAGRALARLLHARL